MKKLGKILPKDELKLFENEIEQEFKKSEKDCDTILDTKVKEIENQ